MTEGPAAAPAVAPSVVPPVSPPVAPAVGVAIVDEVPAAVEAPDPEAPGGARPGTPARGDRVRASLTHGGTVWMLVGSLVAAGGAYLFQMYAAQAVGSRAYAPISVLWTIQYLLLSVLLYSVEAWALRAVTQAGGGLSTLGSAGGVLAGLLTGIAVVLGGVVWATSDRLFVGHAELAGAVCLTVLSYALFVLVRAVLAGRNRFKAYGVVTSLESVVRLLLVVLVVAAGGGAEAIAWSMPFGALAAAAYWLIARRTRPAPDRPADAAGADAGAGLERPGRFLLAAVPANACSQVLLAGGPLVLVAIGALPEVTSTFFVAVTVARMPLVIAQGGLLSRLLPTLSAMARAGDVAGLARWCVGTAAAAAAAGAVAAAVAAVLGPAVLALLYGADFRPSVALAAGAAAAVTLSAGSMLLNQVLVACRREASLVVPWAVALLAAGAAVAAWPGHAEGRVLLGTVVGQVVALLALLVSCLGHVRGLRPAETSGHSR